MRPPCWTTYRKPEPSPACVMNTGEERPLMNEVRRMCTPDKLKAAGGAVRFFGGAGFGAGVRLAVVRGLGRGDGLGEGDGLADGDGLGDDDEGVGADWGFLCE